MQGLDSSLLGKLGTATFAVPAWLAAVLAVLFVALLIASWRRLGGRHTAALTIRFASVLLVGGVAIAALSQWQVHERFAERLALANRASELNLRALAPGSPLTCLAAEGAEAVETACEQVVFARADNAAAAIAFTAAQLSLYADIGDYARDNDPKFVEAYSRLRRTIELDRYGFVAHILTTRDGCNAEKCDYFARLRDAAVLQANIKANAFETYVARYAEIWQGKVLAAVPPTVEPKAAENESPPASAPTPSAKYDYPSAASIPPVSIMSSEPKLPKPNEGEAKPAEEEASAKALPIPPRRPQNQAAAPR